MPCSFQLCSRRTPSRPHPPSCVWHSHAYLQGETGPEAESTECLMQVAPVPAAALSGPVRPEQQAKNEACKAHRQIDAFHQHMELFLAIQKDL